MSRERRRRSLSDSGEDTASTTSRKASGRSLDSQNQPHWASTFFSFIAQHPTLPNTLSQYAQFIFNMFWLTLLAYIIYSFWAVVRSDVDRKSEVYMIDIIAEKISCAKQYNANNCDPGSRAPALEIQCNQWDKCRNQNERKIARGMVSARTFAEIFNSFVEEISYKAMAFSCILIFGCFAHLQLRLRLLPAQDDAGDAARRMAMGTGFRRRRRRRGLSAGRMLRFIRRARRGISLLQVLLLNRSLVGGLGRLMGRGVRCGGLRFID